MVFGKRTLALLFALVTVVASAHTPAHDDDGLAEAAKVIGSRKDRARARAHEMAATKEALPVALMPLVGTTRYLGGADDLIAGGLTTGAIVELSVTEKFSVEIEAGYERASLSYASVRADNTLTAGFGHAFSRGQLGLNLKSYVWRGIVNPYVGVGFHGVRYDGMTRGPEDRGAPFEQWVGGAEATAGLEIAFTPSFSIGARAAFTQPVANLPAVETRNNGQTIAMGSEELAMMRIGYLRLCAGAKVSF